MTRMRMAGLVAFFGAFSIYARAVSADTVSEVYTCGEAVAVQFQRGDLSTYWMFLDPSDGTTTQKTVDRYYAILLTMFVTGKGASVFSGASATVPCVGVSGNRLIALQVYK